MLYPEFQKDLSKLIVDYDSLGGKIYKFIEYVKTHWKTADNRQLTTTPSTSLPIPSSSYSQHLSAAQLHSIRE